MNARLARARDITSKAWKYVQHLPKYPELPLLALKGIHMGEYISLKQSWLLDSGIQTIIDVGANTGQFTSAIGKLLPDASIYSFEPLPECYQQLCKKMEKRGFFEAFNVALGNEHKQITLWKSDFLKSSSVLSMESLHKKTFPWSANSVSLTVQMEKLDEYIGKMDLRSKVLLKIDVQGYELPVLQGGKELLQTVDYVIVETSFWPLYEGQSLFDETYAFLRQGNFRYIGSLDQLVSPLDKRILQADLLFMR